MSADARHKFIRRYEVTHAAVHDRHVFEQLLDRDNTHPEVWADSAYSGLEKLEILKALGLWDRLQRQSRNNRKLTDAEKLRNRRRSRTRCRIEHIFGVQAQRAGSLLLRTIGIVRARCKIGLRNLAYNLDRYAKLKTAT